MAGGFNSTMNQHSGKVYNHAYGNSVRMNASMAPLPISSHDPYAIEKAAKIHRSPAAVCEASCTWSGQLSRQIHSNPFYSCKVFLGGVPWDLNDSALRASFFQFGDIHVEWPGGRDGGANSPEGYVYIVFEDERQVKHFLSTCFVGDDSNYYFKLSDGNFVACPSY